MPGITRDQALAQWLAQAAQCARDGIGPGRLAPLPPLSDQQIGAPEGIWHSMLRSNLAGQVKDALRFWSDVQQLNAGMGHSDPMPPRIARQVRGARPFGCCPIWGWRFGWGAAF